MSPPRNRAWSATSGLSAWDPISSSGFLREFGLRSGVSLDGVEGGEGGVAKGGAEAVLVNIVTSEDIPGCLQVPYI